MTAITAQQKSGFLLSNPASLPFTSNLASIAHQPNLVNPAIHPFDRLNAPFLPATSLQVSPNYPGPQYTLGPTFSDEEDGDDSSFIALKMAMLGLDPIGGPHSEGSSHSVTSPDRWSHLADPLQPNGSRQIRDSRATVQVQTQAQVQYRVRQQQMADLQARQQQAIIFRSYIAAQHQPGSPFSQQRVTEALAMLNLQQAQLATTNPHLQAQLLLQAQAQRALIDAQRQPGYAEPHLTLPLYASATSQRNSSIAQVQANRLARTDGDRPMNPNDADLRARFENAPTTSNDYKTPTNASHPVFEQVWSPPPYTPSNDLGRSPASANRAPVGNALKSPPTARSGQSLQAISSSHADSLATFLSRVRGTGPSRSGSNNSTSGPIDSNDATSISQSTQQKKAFEMQGLGHGKPNNMAVTERAWSAPVASHTLAKQAPRAVSYAGPIRAIAMRQPLGPPGGAKELDERNFHSRSVPDSRHGFC